MLKCNSRSRVYAGTNIFKVPSIDGFLFELLAEHRIRPKRIKSRIQLSYAPFKIKSISI
uniref:Uncharacterized protein n=1 Tax=Arundo donax TaxID=35708 RepID=A0A0A9C3W4_ARUDO